MSGKTIEQERAKFALGFVNDKTKDKDREDYKTLIKRLPAMVLNNGIGQALAFLLAKAETDQNKPSYKLFGALKEWLRTQNVYTGDDLMDALTKGTRAQYMQARHETLKLLTWMTKFADAYLAEGAEKK
jgi:CRISPR-associated protein Cmr5